MTIKISRKYEVDAKLGAERLYKNRLMTVIKSPHYVEAIYSV